MSTAVEYTLTVDKGGATLLWQGQTFEVEASDLREGGWEFEPACERDHCDDGTCAPCPYCDGDGVTPPVAEMLKRWHDDESGHSGPFKFCDHEPCKGIGQELQVRFG